MMNEAPPISLGPTEDALDDGETRTQSWTLTRGRAADAGLENRSAFGGPHARTVVAHGECHDTRFAIAVDRDEAARRRVLDGVEQHILEDLTDLTRVAEERRTIGVDCGTAVDSQLDVRCRGSGFDGNELVLDEPADVDCLHHGIGFARCAAWQVVDEDIDFEQRLQDGIEPVGRGFDLAVDERFHIGDRDCQLVANLVHRRLHHASTNL
jgi:hypothetical protein